LTFKNAREDFNLVGFIALRNEAGRTRAALIQIGLDIGFGQLDFRRTAIHHTANGGAVALAPCGKSK